MTPRIITRETILDHNERIDDFLENEFQKALDKSFEESNYFPTRRRVIYSNLKTKHASDESHFPIQETGLEDGLYIAADNFSKKIFLGPIIRDFPDAETSEIKLVLNLKDFIYPDDDLLTEFYTKVIYDAVELSNSRSDITMTIQQKYAPVVPTTNKYALQL